MHCFDFGFENVNNIVDDNERSRVLEEFREFVINNRGTEASQWSESLKNNVDPMKNVQFDSQPEHFGYALVRIQVMMNDAPLTLLLLMGAANGRVEIRNDITAAHKSSRTLSTEKDKHTEVRIVDRLAHLLGCICRRANGFQLQDIFIMFHTQKKNNRERTICGVSPTHQKVFGCASSTLWCGLFRIDFNWM